MGGGHHLPPLSIRSNADPQTGRELLQCRWHPEEPSHRMTVQMIDAHPLRYVKDFRKPMKPNKFGRQWRCLPLLHVRERSGIIWAVPDRAPSRGETH